MRAPGRSSSWAQRVFYTLNRNNLLATTQVSRRQGPPPLVSCPRIHWNTVLLTRRPACIGIDERPAICERPAVRRQEQAKDEPNNPNITLGFVPNPSCKSLDAGAQSKQRRTAGVSPVRIQPWKTSRSAT